VPVQTRPEHTCGGDKDKRGIWYYLIGEQNTQNTQKQAINLLSLNTNGLRDGKKRRGLFNWLKKFHDAHNKFILLQETHTDNKNEGEWKTDWGNRNIIFAHGDSKSRGVAVLLPNDIDYTITSQECDPNGRYVVVNLVIDDNDYCIINCYAPTSDYPIEQLEWLCKIQGFIEQANDKNIIIGGDLNDYFIPYLDKYNPKINLAETDYIKAWKATNNDKDICDIWRIMNPEVKKYTWRHGKSINNLRQSRLDYWLISTHMIYDLNNVDIKPGYRSDHSLIDISFLGHNTTSRGPSYWRFNANLLRNIEYTTYMNTRIDEIITKHENIDDHSLLWETIKMEIRSSTICFSKKDALKKRNEIKDTVIKCNNLESQLSTNPSEDILNEYNEAKLEIEQYNSEKAQGAFIRSKADWAEFGEKNTKYFLNLEKRNYKNKCITTLINEKEETINQSDKILNYETEFYKKLYTIPKHEGNITRLQTKDEFLDVQTPQITNEDMELCELQIDLEDIGYALNHQEQTDSLQISTSSFG
jgi:exonuclease III